MSFRAIEMRRAHRLLAPRITFLIGTIDATGVPNVIPVTHLSSLCSEPQEIIVSVYRKWRTCKSLEACDGFTVSVPTIAQLPGLWRLGPDYSGWRIREPREKLARCGLEILHTKSPWGPVVNNCLGWMECRLACKVDTGGDHVGFVGRVLRAEVSESVFDADEVPALGWQPAMQLTGNVFCTMGDRQAIPFYAQEPQSSKR